MSSAAAGSPALRLGTRGSKLARWQADWVAAQLRQQGRAVEIIEIATLGDVDSSETIGDIGAPGVFTKEIQRALLRSEIDVAVHSLKDLPTDLVEGLTVGAVPLRESPADVLVARDAASLTELPAGARVGTGSLRRQAQLRYARPDLQVENIRGNVDTRLRKLDEGQFDAIVLAEAGLKRLQLMGRITQVLPASVMMSAVGQGALGIECRSDDAATLAAVGALDDLATRAAVTAERALLARLQGGYWCHRVLGEVVKKQLNLSAVVLSPDGSRRLAAADAASPHNAELLGRRLAESLLERGAGELIAACRT